MTFPDKLIRELRTDHAGEVGAVMIYKGILAVSRDPAVRAFAQRHLATEQRHLELLEQIVPRKDRSKLLPLWNVSAVLTGVIPALFGPTAVYATIAAVETFVTQHYEDQLVMIDTMLAGTDLDENARYQLGRLRTMIVSCQVDEVEHRKDAEAHAPGPINPALKLWTQLVGAGSRAAVKVCRHI